MRQVSLDVARHLRLGLVGVALATGCAASPENQEELSRLRQDLHALRAELGQTKQTVDALSDRLTLLSARSEAAPQAPKAIGALPVVKLERKREKHAGDGGASDDGSEPILIKLGPEDSSEKLSVDRDVLTKPDPVLSTKGAKATDKREKVDYDAALSLLREQAKPVEARELLISFAARYPRSDLADNVAYWLAECTYAEGLWSRAIAEFSAMIEARPESQKVPDALLRTAEAWLKLSKTKEAEDVLRRLIKNYPTSAAKGTAEQRLSELGAT